MATLAALTILAAGPALARTSPLPHRQASRADIHYGARGALAADWQVSQLVHGHMPGFRPGSPDWGLTVDVALMLAADGKHPDVLRAVERGLAAHVLDYVTYKGDTFAGAASKLLLAAKVLKADPADFGGQNLRAMVLGLVAPPRAGFEAGRLRDTGRTDYSNVFTQAYGTLALARTGSIPQRVVDYLLKQRCTDGSFRLYETAGQTCDQAGGGPDVDATSLSLQALLAARADGASVSSRLVSGTASWLVSVQQPNGSYSEDATADAPSANSTGLAANALAATGHDAPRLAAADWVASVQITKARAGDGPAKTDIGAIALDKAALKDALAHGLGDNRSQWWRVAPQAYFALAPAPLNTLSAP